MTVSELLDALQELVDDGHGDKDVMLATQPNYPLASTLKGVVNGEELGDGEGLEPDTSVVWLLEGSQRRTGSPYAPRDLWDLCN